MTAMTAVHVVLSRVRLVPMPFGQQSGPPASHQQVQELLALLQEAGHTDFRDARGPMRFTQRQAGGKFTREEAAAFIEQLLHEADGTDSDPDTGHDRALHPSVSGPKPRAARLSATEQTLRKIPAEQLAAELQRRGWVVMEP